METSWPAIERGHTTGHPRPSSRACSRVHRKSVIYADQVKTRSIQKKHPKKVSKNGVLVSSRNERTRVQRHRGENERRGRGRNKVKERIGEQKREGKELNGRGTRGCGRRKEKGVRRRIGETRLPRMLRDCIATWECNDCTGARLAPTCTHVHTRRSWECADPYLHGKRSLTSLCRPLPPSITGDPRAVSRHDTCDAGRGLRGLRGKITEPRFETASTWNRGWTA